jgi:hypothetical protein
MRGAGLVLQAPQRLPELRFSDANIAVLQSAAGLRWSSWGKKRIVLPMAGELIPQIVIEAAERRGSVDETVSRWIAYAYQPQPTDIRRLWADHFASVADYWRHKTRHPESHAGAMVILYEWARRRS